MFQVLCVVYGVIGAYEKTTTKHVTMINHDKLSVGLYGIAIELDETLSKQEAMANGAEAFGEMMGGI